MRSPFSVAADARTAAPSPTNAVSRLSGLGTFVPSTLCGLWTVNATHNSASSSTACSVTRVCSGLLGSCRAVVQQSAARRHIAARLSRSCAAIKKSSFWSCLAVSELPFSDGNWAHPCLLVSYMPLEPSSARIDCARGAPLFVLILRFVWLLDFAGLSI